MASSLADDLEESLKNFTLTEEEQDNVVLDQGLHGTDLDESEAWMVGKLFINRPFNKEAMLDKAKVLDGAPWSFDKHHLVFKDIDGELRPDDYVFDRAMFWIQIYGLLLKWMNSNTAKAIGIKICSFKGIDCSLEKIGWGSFLRIRVEINLTNLLRRVVSLVVKGGDGYVQSDYVMSDYHPFVIFVVYWGTWI
ncbi:hypothetical protein REPUB_Repub01dG0077500 [Reevesia pubescens]